MTFEVYKRAVEALLRDCGWSTRGIFYALKTLRVRDAFDSGEAPEAFKDRVNREAPLGMACR